MASTGFCRIIVWVNSKTSRTVPCGGPSIIWHQSFQPHYMYILYVLAHATFESNGLSLHWVTLVRKQWIILTVLAFWDNFKQLHVSIIGATQFYHYKYDSPVAFVNTNYLGQALFKWQTNDYVTFGGTNTM